MSRQNVRSSKDLTGQNQFLTGHCPLNGPVKGGVMWNLLHMYVK